jgi:hypothetical protein
MKGVSMKETTQKLAVLVLVALMAAFFSYWFLEEPVEKVVPEARKAVVPATTISTVPSQQPIVVSGEDQVLEVEFHFVDAIDQQPITIDAIQISHFEPDRVTAVAIPLPEDGVFHIPFDEVVGKIQLVVTAEGYFRIQDSLQVDTPAKISIPLVPRATLHCLVRSLDARPLAGAMVQGDTTQIAGSSVQAGNPAGGDDARKSDR